MALKRNGFHKDTDKRNKGSSHGNGIGTASHAMVPYKDRYVTKSELNFLRREDNRVLEWVNEIRKEEKFSRNWILSCLTEITLQSMGKVPHVTGRNGHVLGFFPGTAIRSLKLMAEIQGYNIFKLNKELGTVTRAIGDHPGEQERVENNKPREIELNDNEQIIADTVQILFEAGAFESKSKKAADAEVVEVHST